MKLTNLDTYLFILKNLGDDNTEQLCANHPHERISISVLKYLLERNRILKECERRKSAPRVADENGLSHGKVYRAINCQKKHKM